MKGDKQLSLPEKVHMIAVCGTGMGALALLFREAGVRVTVVATLCATSKALLTPRLLASWMYVAVMTLSV